MLIAAAFLSFISFAAANPAPSNEIPACSGGRARLDLGEFNSYSFQACARFFEHGAPKTPAQNTVHIWVGDKSPQDGSERKDIYTKITWKLEGNVSAMGSGSCEYAFTNREAYDDNANKGNICSWVFSGGQQTIRGMGIMAWDFQREDRKYVAEFATEESPRQDNVPWDKKTFWE
jgi:hypothetical protein